MCISCGINNITKEAIFCNSGGRGKEFGSLDGGEDGEYECIHFVEVSQRFAMQRSGAISFDCQMS